MLSWVLLIGVLLDWLGSGFNSMGNIFMKLHTTTHHDWKNPLICCVFYRLWSFAIFCFLWGGIVDTLSLAMIPVSVWAANTAVSIPMSVILAGIFLGDRISATQWGTIIVITLGSIGTVWTGNQELEGQTSNYENFSESISETRGMILASVFIMLQLIAGNTMWGVLKRHSPDGIPNDDYSDDAVEEGVNNIHNLYRSISHAQRSRYVSTFMRMYNIVCGAFLAAIQSCWTSLFMKMTTELFEKLPTDAHIERLNWMCIPFLVVSCFFQLTFIQWMMKCFQAVIIIPVYQCFLILLICLFGIAFMKEYPKEPLGFGIMVFIVCAGLITMMFINENKEKNGVKGAASVKPEEIHIPKKQHLQQIELVQKPIPLLSESETSRGNSSPPKVSVSTVILEEFIPSDHSPLINKLIHPQNRFNETIVIEERVISVTEPSSAPALRSNRLSEPDSCEENEISPLLIQTQSLTV